MDRLKELAHLYNNGELTERQFISSIVAKISMLEDPDEIGALASLLLRYTRRSK